MLLLFLDGIPQPYARPGGGRTCRRYNPKAAEKKSAQWKVISQYNAEPLDDPVKVSFQFFFPVPRSMSKKKQREMLQGKIRHTKKPDVDNLVKFYLDVLNDLVIDDDKQVVEITATKNYSNNPQTIITIEKLTGED